MKKICIILAVLMLFSILTACDGGSNESSSQQSSSQQSSSVAETIEIRVMSRWSDDQPRSVLFRQRIDEFNQQNNGIKIIGEHINDEPAYLDKLRTGFATGDQPHVFFGYGGTREYEYVKSGMIMNLEPVFEANKDWYETFKPMFDKWQYSDIDGTFGVPLETYSIAVFYNTEIFENLNLEVPKTIAEFEQINDKILAENLIPIALGAKDSWRVGHFFNNLSMKTYGAEVVNKLADRSLAYGSEGILDILTRIQSYNTKGYFGPNAISVDYNNEKTLFFEGKSAMHMDGSWFLGEAAQSEIADKIAVMPFPAVNSDYYGSWFGSAAGLSITKITDKNVEDAAIAVVKYLSDKQFFIDDLSGSKGGIYPVEFAESDIAGIEISSVSKSFIEAMGTATEFRDDVQTYDPLPSMLDVCRSSFQGLFAGKSPTDVANDILAEIASRS